MSLLSIRTSRLARLFVTGSLAAAPLLLAGVARAQGPDSAPATTGAPKAPAPATPAPAAPPPAGPAAPAAPAPVAVVVGGYTCFVGDHQGFDDSDARTTTTLACHEIEKKHGSSSQYEVRLGKLGGKILLTVADKQTGEERDMLIQGFDEVPVAAPRVVDALIDKKTIEQTQTVDNVAGQETRAPKIKPGQIGFEMGILGMTGVGVDPGFSSGVSLGMVFRLNQLAVTSHGRAGGIGSAANKIGFAAIDVGGRYYFSDEDFAPFAGAGFQFGYFRANRSPEPSSQNDIDGSGLAAFGELGIEALRSGRVGLTASLRADVPFFLMEGVKNYYTYSSGTGSSQPNAGQQQYVLPVSLNLGLVFH